MNWDFKFASQTMRFIFDALSDFRQKVASQIRGAASIPFRCSDGADKSYDRIVSKLRSVET